MVAVADSFKGYQYFEFSMLKDLTDESRKLAKLTRKKSEPADESTNLAGGTEKRDNTTDELDDFDDLNKRLDEIFTGEYKDDPENEIRAAMESNKLAAATNSKKERECLIICGGSVCVPGISEDFFYVCVCIFTLRLPWSREIQT